MTAKRGVIGARIGVASVALAVAAATTLPRPGVVVSNRLTPAGDARVVRSTVRPKASWVEPYHWTATLDGAIRMQADDVVGIVDSISGGYPNCQTYRVTVKPTAPSGDSLTKKLSVCRKGTIGERALADSYPTLELRTAGRLTKPGDTATLCPLRRNRHMANAVRLEPPAGVTAMALPQYIETCRPVAEAFAAEKSQ